jgi:hypothetical protein
MPPLETLAKHLSGKHDQKTHGGGGAGGSSSASSPSSPEPAGSLDGVPFGSDYLNDINYEMYEPNPPAVLYHVAPKSARDDIATNGLDPADRTWNTGASMGGEYRDEHLWTTGDDGEEFAYEYRPEGVYMFSDLGRAKQYAAGNKGDIYQIDTEVNSREIIRDPSQATNWKYEDPTEHAYVTRYVEPAALTRLDVGKSVGEPIFKHGDHSDPDHDLGIGRRDMPQIDVAQFTRMLQRRGIESTRRTLDPATLRRSQDGLNPKKVRDIATSGEPIDRIIVSRDDHILDGHHRWAAATERGEDIEALVVDMGIEELLALVERSDVEKATVIRFAPGLVPRLNTTAGIMKHLPGQHDQAQHGRKGSGGDTRAALEARAAALDAEGRGASAAVYRLRLHTDGPGGVRAFTRGESDSASLPVRDGQRQQVATKAVHELTPDARAILRAGGISTPVVHELDAENGGAEFFHAAISRSKEGNPYASSVFVYEPEEYRGMRLFVSDDGQSGIALKGDEIVSLFKTGTSGDREVSRPLLELGIQEGGRRGDCFDTVLPKIYAEHGLEVRHRVAWNDEYAPEGWDKRLYKKWNNGEPDVTFFRYNRDYTDEYRPGQGSLVDSYDDAVALTQAAVLKHLKGQHDQKTHGGDGAAALPSGWTEYEARSVDEMQPDGTFVTHPRRTFGGPNQTVVTVTGTDIPASRVNQILTDVTTLQGIAPVENLKVDVGDGPFAQQGFSDTVYGFVPVGQSRIFLRPEARPFVDPGFNMPVLADDPGRYTLVHEYGHVLDRRSAEKAAEDKSIVIASHQTGMSRYAFAEEPVQPGREAFAEAFVGWVGSQGTFASEGPSGKAFVRYFANKYGWDSGGPGRPPSAGFAKQASGGSGLLIADTFSAEGPKQVMPRSPVAKHGDPSRPGYAQLHPTGPTGRYADWGDHASRIAEAEGRGPSSEALSFMAAGETYYDTEEEALEAFKEVYNYRHEGTNNNGERVVLTAEVTGVLTNPGDGTFVEGRIKNEQGQQVGWFERTFRTDSDDVPVVEHVLLELKPEAQGTGFATEFNARAEDYYVSHGVDAITLHAALGNGGYTWAKAGYAFDTRPTPLRETRDLLGFRLDNPEEYVTSGGPRDLQQLRDLGSRLRKSPTDPDFPTPLEISRVGYTEGATTWAGKELLVGSEWFGEKLLRAEGPTAKAVAVQVLKHGDPSRPGYAQLHPTGAGSAYAEWGDHAGRIAAAEGRGPSEDVLRTAINGGSLLLAPEDEIAEWIEQNRPDDIDMTIDNNYGLYQRKEKIEETEYERDWERDEAIQDLRRDAAYLLASEDAHMYSEAMGRGPYYDDDEVQAAFGEVYNYMHSGVNKQGDPVNLSAEVMSVETSQGNVKVSGVITDYNGNPVGNFERRFFKDDDGRLMVEHELLELDDSVQGAGFATEFNANAEDYYVSHGIEAIRVHAGLDQGGYTWASAGFDFDPRPWSLKQSKANITGRIDDYLSDTSPDRAPLTPAQRERLTSLRDRLESKDHTDPDFPTPFEIASFGRTSGAETWPGSEIMTGSNWYGEKPLTPGGRRRSATEAANKSALIRIAPGLVPTLKHLRGRHDQRTHFPGAGRSGAELRQEAEERNIDYLLRGDTWVDEQLSRGRVLLPPPPGVIERVAEARNRVKQWVEERRNPPVDSLSHDEVLELVRINRATVDAERAARGLPPKDWPPYPDPVSKAAGDVLAILGRVFAGVVDDRLIRLMALMGPLEDVGEPWSGLLGDMIEGALTGLPDDVFKHLAGKHDQKTHGSGGGGYAAGGEEFQRDQESWFNGMLEERQGGDSPLLTEGQMRLPVTERLKAAVAARLAERMSDVPADRMAEAAFVTSKIDWESAQLKAAREAMIPGSWVTIRDPLTRSMEVGFSGQLMVKPDDGTDPGVGWVRSGTPEAAAKVRQASASHMVQMWASSSNDDNIVSLAVQDAAAAEFGMEGHAPWPARGDVGRVARERADAMTASHGDVYRRYVRAQYEETQAMFSDLGIGSVRVHRGVVVEESVMRDAFDVSGTQLTGGARLRPLSSWSSDPKEAQSFAMDAIRDQETQFRVVMETRLPVSQILSTPYTGVGCLGEDEVVSVTPTVDAAINIVGKVG